MLIRWGGVLKEQVWALIWTLPYLLPAFEATELT